MQTTGGFAFPHSVKNWNDHLLHEQHGMTLRDYLAAHAPVTYEMAREIWGGQPEFNDPGRVSFFAVWALARYEYADAMLAERQENRP